MPPSCSSLETEKFQSGAESDTRKEWRGEIFWVTDWKLVLIAGNNLFPSRSSQDTGRFSASYGSLGRRGNNFMAGLQKSLLPRDCLPQVTQL